MQKYIWYCPLCAKESVRKSGHSDIFVPGFVDYFNEEPTRNIECLDCHQDILKKLSITVDEFQILRYVSNEPEFILTMDQLKQSNIIEYQLKMSQFKASTSQQNSSDRSSNQPKCPTCGCADIERISTASKAVNVALFGLLGNRRKKTFRCNHCKYEW